MGGSRASILPGQIYVANICKARHVPWNPPLMDWTTRSASRWLRFSFFSCSTMYRAAREQSLQFSWKLPRTLVSPDGSRLRRFAARTMIWMFHPRRLAKWDARASLHPHRAWQPSSIAGKNCSPSDFRDTYVVRLGFSGTRDNWQSAKTVSNSPSNIEFARSRVEN